VVEFNNSTPVGVELKEYIEALMTGHVQRLDTEIRAARETTALALAASDKATTKAEDALTRRLESMNEIRAQLGEQAGTFARQDVVNTQFIGVVERLARLEGFQNRMMGALVVVPMVTSVLVGLVVYFVTR
jgi:hypothetical protein